MFPCPTALLPRAGAYLSAPARSPPCLESDLPWLWVVYLPALHLWVPFLQVLGFLFFFLFLTQGSNPSLLSWQVDSLPAEPQGKHISICLECGGVKWISRCEAPWTNPGEHGKDSWELRWGLFLPYSRLVYLVHQLNKVLFKYSYLFGKFKWFLWFSFS